MSAYHGSACVTPPSTVVSSTPGKKSFGSSAGVFASHGSSGSSAPSSANSGIHVLPSWITSGSAPPTNAVSSFSCAALHGICCTRTVTPGLRASKSGTSART